MVLAPGRRVLALGDTDSRLKWSIHLARSLSDAEIDVRSLDTDARPSDRQVAELGVGDYGVVTWDTLIEGHALSNYDVVVACLIGTRLHRLRRIVADHCPVGRPRPVLVAGYAGVVYERHLEGALWRVGYDVICANSSDDRAIFATAFDHLSVSTDALAVTGLAVAHAAEPVDTVWPPKRIVFAVQPDVPERRSDRVGLLRALVAYARRHPQREVIVKLRTRPGEVTTHPEPYNYAELLQKEFSDAPPNLLCRLGNMASILDTTDLLITVSSTAAMEAWARGIPVGILSDAGVGESLGNHHFVASGAVTSIACLVEDIRPDADPAWLESAGITGIDLDAVRTMIGNLVAPAQAGTLPFPEQFVDAARTPALLERTEASWAWTTGSGIVATIRRRLHGPVRRLGRRVARWFGP